MERSVIFQQSLLVLLVAKHVTSMTSSCLCTFPSSFCTEGITAVQGQLLSSRLVNQEGKQAVNESMAHKTKYRIKLTQLLINGSHALSLTNNTFQFSYQKGDPCDSGLRNNTGLILIGHVDQNGKFGKPVCYMPLPSRSTGLNKRESGFDLFGEPTTFQEVCKSV